MSSYSLGDAREIATLPLPARYFFIRPTFSPLGSYAAALAYNDIPSNQSSVCFWQGRSGAAAGCLDLEDHTYAFAFSPDERFIVTGSEDRTARVWDVEGKTEIARVAHDDGVWSVAFSPPDGKYLATASGDGTVRVWLWRPGDLIHEACSRLPRNLTPAEWQTYIGSEGYVKTCEELPDPEREGLVRLP